MPLPLLALLVVAVHPRWTTPPVESPAEVPAPREPVVAAVDA
jgi:hypothetical protein